MLFLQEIEKFFGSKLEFPKFINIYDSSVRTQVFASCSQVQEALKHLAQSKFINKFPFLRKKYEKLRNSSDLKLLRDYTVPETMDSIYNEFDVNLRQILNLVGKGEIQEASNQLQFFLSETRNSFNHMQTLLRELHLIQSKL